MLGFLGERGSFRKWAGGWCKSFQGVKDGSRILTVEDARMGFPGRIDKKCQQRVENIVLFVTDHSRTQ